MHARSLGYDPRPEARDWRGTPIPPVKDPLTANATLVEMAERIWWNGPAWTILRNSGRFLRHAMDHATESDLAYREEHVATDRWRQALQEATPGTMSRSRYRLWCLWLGIDEQVPASEWHWKGHLNDSRPNDNRERAYRRHAQHAARRRPKVEDRLKAHG